VISRAVEPLTVAATMAAGLMSWASLEAARPMAAAVPGGFSKGSLRRNRSAFS